MEKGNTKNPDGILAAIFSDLKKGAESTPTARWLGSDRVSRVCRDMEVARLEEAGHLIGGLA